MKNVIPQISNKKLDLKLLLEEIDPANVELKEKVNKCAKTGLKT